MSVNLPSRSPNGGSATGHGPLAHGRWCLLLLLLGAVGCPLAPAAPTPEAPKLSPPASPTNEPLQVIAGTKPAGTGVLVNQSLVVPVDGETTFTATVTLAEGLNNISVAAVDGAGRSSPVVSVAILLDTTPPPAPTIEPPPPARTLAERIEVTGRAEEGSEVLVGGEVAEFTGPIDWRAEVDLGFGANEIRVSARDALGNESDATSVVVVREPFLFTVDPVPALVGSDLLQVTGERRPGIAVLLTAGDETIVVADAESEDDTWQVEVSLVEGENRFSITGDHEQRTETVDFTVVLDTLPPQAPVLDPVPPLSTAAELTLSGTKEPGSGVEVNGALVVATDESAAFTAAIRLAPGANTLSVIAVDGAQNRSAAVAPAPEVYFDPLGLYLTVDPVPPVVATGTLTLSGRRATNADIYVEGSLAAPTDGSTSWQAQIALSPGPNTLEVEAAVGAARRVVTVSTTYSDQAPAAPTLDVPAVTSSSPVTVTGTKPAGTAVLRADGSPVTLLDDTTAFVDVVNIPEGVSTLSYFARDAFGRVSPTASADVTLDSTPPASAVAFPPAGAVVGASVVVQGSATDALGVDAVSVCVGACAQDGDYAAANFTAGSTQAPFDAIFDASALPASLDGSVVDLHVRVVDAAGNRSETTTPVMLMRRPLALSRDPAFDLASPAVDVSAGPARELAVVFSHPTAPSGSDVYAVLEDGLAISGTALLLSDGPEHGFADEPAVARAPSGEIHVVWADDGAAGSGVPGAPGLVHRSVVGGVLSAPIAVQAQGGVALPDVVATPGGLAAVWRREQTAGLQDYAIELAAFDGSSWSAPVAVAADGDGLSSAPDAPRVAVSDDGRLHVVWSDAGNLDGTADDDRDIYYRAFDPSLAALGGPVLVSDGGNLTDGESALPAVAAVGADPAHRVLIAWIEAGAVDGAGAGLDKAVLRSLDDNGAGPVLDASDVPGRQDADEVDVAVDDTGAGAVIFVARGGDVAGSGADADVFLRRYDGALAADVVAISDATGDTVSTGESALCRVALDAIGNHHVVWVEASDLDGTLAGPADADVMTFAIGPEAP